MVFNRQTERWFFSDSLHIKLFYCKLFCECKTKIFLLYSLMQLCDHLKIYLRNLQRRQITMTAAARKEVRTSRATLSDVTFDPPGDTERCRGAGASPGQQMVNTIIWTPIQVFEKKNWEMSQKIAALLVFKTYIFFLCHCCSSQNIHSCNYHVTH